MPSMIYMDRPDCDARSGQALRASPKSIRR